MIPLSRLRDSRLYNLIHRYRIAGIAVLVLVVLALFITQNRTEANRVAEAVREANPYWIGMALFAHLMIVSAAGLSYRVILQLLGHRHSWSWLTNLHLKRHIAGTVTPIGGPASIYVLVRTLKHRGVSTDDALFAGMIRGVVGYCSFVVLLLPVLLLGDPSGYVLAGSAALFALMLILLAGMALLVRSSWNPVRAPERLQVLLRQMRRHQLGIREFALPFLLALVHNLLGVATLYFSLLAVGYDGGVIAAFIGYAIGNLFMMIAPVFQGIGVVEFTMAVSLQHAGVPLAAAAAATILFRLADVWFPLLLGLLTHLPIPHRGWAVLARPQTIVMLLTGVVIGTAALSDISRAVLIANAEDLLALSAAAVCLVVACALWRRLSATSIATYGTMASILPVLGAQISTMFDVPPLLFLLGSVGVGFPLL